MSFRYEVMRLCFSTVALIAIFLWASCARWGFEPGARGDGAVPDHTALDATADVSAIPDASWPADGSPLPDAPATDASSVSDAPWPPDASLLSDAPAIDAPPISDALSPSDNVVPDAPSPPTGVLWAQQIGGTWHDEGLAIAIDASDNIYLAGTFADTVDFGGGPVSANSSGGTDGFLASYASNGAFRWVTTFGGASPDEATAVAVDPLGNVAVAGSFFSSSIDFGGGPVSKVGPTTPYADAFVASFSSADGSYQWARTFGSTGGEHARGVAADTAGNVTVTGTFDDGTDFGGGALSTMGNSLDIFLASYTSTGAHRWSQSFGGAAGEDEGTALAADNSNNLYLTGSFVDSASLGGSKLTGNGGSDIFLASYTSAGSHRWSTSFGGTSTDKGAAVALDQSGNLYLTGAFRVAADFGGGLLTSAGGADAVLASYVASNGAFRWAHRFGGTGDDYGRAVAADSNNSVFATGSFNNTASFSASGSTTLVSAGNNDIVVASTTSTGAYRWANHLGGTAADKGQGLARSTSGLLVTGSFFGTVDFGAALLSAGSYSDIFLITLQP